MNIKGLKNKVIQRRTNGNAKLGNDLAKVIDAYEKSRITKDYLLNYYKQLLCLQK